MTGEWKISTKDVSKIIGPQPVELAWVIRDVLLQHWPDIAKAQARQLMEWGERGCLDVDHAIKRHGRPSIRFNCDYCIEQLKQEVMGDA